jgi:hypothetical protein
MRGSPVNFTGFTGGVNLADEPYNLGDGEARDLLNVIATGTGRGAQARRRLPGGEHDRRRAAFPGGPRACLDLLHRRGRRLERLVGVAFRGCDQPGLGVLVCALELRAGRQGGGSPGDRCTPPTGRTCPSSGRAPERRRHGRGQAFPGQSSCATSPTGSGRPTCPPATPPRAGRRLMTPGRRSSGQTSAIPGSFPGANLLLLSPNDGEEIMGTGDARGLHARLQALQAPG